MRIVQLGPADDDAVRACWDTRNAARAVDDLVNRPMALGTFTGWLRVGWSANPSEAWYVPGEAAGAAAAGWCRLDFPDLENRDRAFASIVVHPAVRRRGIGRALLRHAAARSAAHGRSVIGSVGAIGSAGEAFARALGFALGLEEDRRILDLRTVPEGQVARLRAEAAAKAAGYSLIRWTGPTPEERLEQVAGLLNAMNDAPSDAGWEEDRWDARRVRERADAGSVAAGQHIYSVAALHDASGEMAGLTQVYVAPEVPDWGDQGITAVTRPHRGHRLGLLVKATMIEWLAEAEPDLTRVSTDNAASNSYMIAVNEALGYRLAPPGLQFYQIPVADVG